MSAETPNPQPGDKVLVTYETWYAAGGNSLPMGQLIENVRVEVLERADDPSKDEIGTVRREQHAEDATGEAYSVWQHTQYQLSASKAGSHWLCTHSTSFGNLGESLTHDQVRGMPVIGAAPGTPAAEAANPVGLLQSLPDGYDSWADYHEKNLYSPPARPSVRVPNEPHGPSPTVRILMANRIAEGRAVEAVGIAHDAGMDWHAARVYVESMSEYQTYLSEHGRTEVDPAEADRMRAMGFDKQPEFQVSDEDRALIQSVLDERTTEYVYGQDDGSWKLDGAGLSGVVADIVWAAIKRDREWGGR